MNILLTGGSKGIGSSIIKRLIDNNINQITVIGLNKPESDDVNFIECDITNLSNLSAVLEKLKKEKKSYEVLINNAGIGCFGKIEDISLESWNKTLNINLVSVFMIINAFIKPMKESNFGKIINITSDASYIGFPEATAYCASKFALRGLSEALRKELIGYNITVSSIAPGRVDTYFNNKTPGDRPISLKPDDVAEQVLNLIKTTHTTCVEEIRLKSTME